MAAKDWDSCTQVDLLLKRLDTSTHRRSWVLFNCACCRRVWDHMPAGPYRDYVEAAERYALGTFKRKDLDPLKTGVEHALMRSAGISEPGHYAAGAAAATVTNTTRYSAWNAARAVAEPGRAAHRRERQAQADLLREVVGNPLRPRTVEPRWLSWNGSAVPRLAQALYDEPILPAGTLAPAGLGVLADALEDAGCADQALLGHLRGAGPHVRGCWVVALLLAGAGARAISRKS